MQDYINRETVISILTNDSYTEKQKLFYIKTMPGMVFFEPKERMNNAKDKVRCSPISTDQ